MSLSRSVRKNAQFVEIGEKFLVRSRRYVQRNAQPDLRRWSSTSLTRERSGQGNQHRTFEFRVRLQNEIHAEDLR